MNCRAKRKKKKIYHVSVHGGAGVQPEAPWGASRAGGTLIFGKKNLAAQKVAKKKNNNVASLLLRGYTRSFRFQLE